MTITEKRQRIKEVAREWVIQTALYNSHFAAIDHCARLHIEALEQKEKEKESDDFLTAYRTLSILEKDNLKADLAALRDKVAELSLRCLNVRDALNKYHRSKLQSDEDELDRVARGVNSSDLLEPLTAITKERDSLRTQLAKLVEAAKTFRRLSEFNFDVISADALDIELSTSQTLLTRPAAIVEPQEENAIEKRWREKLAEIEHPGSTMKFKTTAADSGKGAA